MLPAKWALRFAVGRNLCSTSRCEAIEFAPVVRYRENRDKGVLESRYILSAETLRGDIKGREEENMSHRSKHSTANEWTVHLYHVRESDALEKAGARRTDTIHILVHVSHAR